jgi:hypothetical protein
MMETSGEFMLPRLAKRQSLLHCIGLILAFAPIAWSQAAAAPENPSDFSGMYSFQREGEFVQLTVEDGRLSGFVSRFGDTDSDKGEFIDQFFDKTSLQGDHLSFKTKTIHALWYEFDGMIVTTSGKRNGEEGYHVLRGKLTLHQSDAAGKEQVSERTVEFKSFPDAQHMRAH